MDHANQKGQWGSRFGFLMAAVGSAVGLGNLWGFPYKMGKSGGFAFLIIYLVLVILVGVVIMMSELALGRKTGHGILAAYRAVSKKYAFVGWLGWISPILILGFYSMLGGYCIKYMVANFGDIFSASWGVGDTDTSEFFMGFVQNQGGSALFSLIFIALTVFIVVGGVSKGIERFTGIAMPALFVMLVIVIIRSVTLPGAGEGLAFIFKPNFEVFKGSGWITVLATAGSQMFFSLSLGMAIMVTYGSYMKKDEQIEQSAMIICISDTIIAVMAAMATMPAVFAAGLEPGQGPGLLFVTLQTVFNSMGSIGPIFGTLFYGLVFIAAITSSISLTEAVAAPLMDRFLAKGQSVNRKKATIVMGVIVAVLGVLVSLDGLGTQGFPQILGQGCWLDAMDLISEGLFMPIGALCTAVIFGWLQPTYLYDEISGGLGDNFRSKGYYHFCTKFLVPPIMLLVLVGQIDTFFGLGIFG